MSAFKICEFAEFVVLRTAYARLILYQPKDQGQGPAVMLRFPNL